MRRRRVVVTGLGVVSPLGIGVEPFWSQLSRGVSGVRRITRFDASPFPSQIAADVTDFYAEAYLPRRDIVRTDTFIQFALTGAIEAMRDAKLEASTGDPRMGVSIGTSMGGLPWILSTNDGLQREQMRGVNPYALPGFLPNMAAAWVSMRFGARGPIACATTACAAGAQAIGDACRVIERDDADVMIAGGSDALVNPFVIACFASLRALSTRNDDPTGASRPFDKDRDGFILGEGAGVLVLEELEHAVGRGCRMYAEVGGYGMTADAHHTTASTVDGPARAMADALADAGIGPERVGYINAHGTSTPHNDANETRAIKEVFGDHAYRLAVSSTKSMTGHLLGAAGAVEAVATVLALKHSVLPPTINYRSPDPECDLDYVPNEACHRDINVALSNSFGFGGVNASLLFRRPDA